MHRTATNIIPCRLATFPPTAIRYSTGTNLILFSWTVEQSRSCCQKNKQMPSPPWRMLHIILGRSYHRTISSLNVTIFLLVLIWCLHSSENWRSTYLGEPL